MVIASTEISHQFLAPKVPIFRRNEIKPPTPVLLTIHFSIAMTIYSRFLDLPPH